MDRICRLCHFMHQIYNTIIIADFSKMSRGFYVFFKTYLRVLPQL